MRPNALPLTALCILVAVATTLPVSSAAHDGSMVLDVVNDLFEVVDASDIALQGGCGGGAFEQLEDSNGFRFYEIPESTRSVGEQESQTGGYESTGCGTASYPIQVPVGTDHVHVRFHATRTIEKAEAGGESAPLDAEQSLHFTVGGSQSTLDYFSRTSENQNITFIDPPKYEVSPPLVATVAWYFEDHSFSGQALPNTFSGISYEATVTDPIIEYSYVPADAFTIDEGTAQSGRDVVAQAIVTSTVSLQTFDTYSRINVRVHVAGNPDLTHVILPDGTTLDNAATRTDSGPDGYDPDAVLVEHFGNTESWFTIPYGIVATQGPGDYTFVVQESQGLTVNGALVPVAVGIGLLPLVASGFALHGILRFRREAFGGFKRAATWLVVAVGALLGYYLAFIAAAFASGSIKRMIILPFDTTAWLLYLQVLIAAGGSVVVFILGRELYRIAVPRRPM